ncbi:hypothetical protein [Aliamphritea spongicola]|nr:hypothetical protein [Aliamphritea spongicola]
MDLNTLKPETRYGCPAADQILYNRFLPLAIPTTSGRQNGRWKLSTRAKQIWTASPG